MLFTYERVWRQLKNASCITSWCFWNEQNVRTWWLWSILHSDNNQPLDVTVGPFHPGPADGLTLTPVWGNWWGAIWSGGGVPHASLWTKMHRANVKKVCFKLLYYSGAVPIIQSLCLQHSQIATVPSSRGALKLLFCYSTNAYITLQLDLRSCVQGVPRPCQ